MNLPSARVFTISNWELIVPGMDDYPEARCFALGLNVDDANNFIAVRKQFEYAYSKSQFRNCDRLDFPNAWNAMQMVVEKLAENIVLLPTLKYLPVGWRQAWIRRMMLYLWGEEMGGFGITARIQESERLASGYIQQGLHIYRNGEPPSGGGGGFGGNWITAASNPRIDAAFRDAFEEAERLYYNGKITRDPASSIARETTSREIPWEDVFLCSRTRLYLTSVAIPRENTAIQLKFLLRGVSTAAKELFPVEELSASTCLAPGKEALIISNYKLELFAWEFEKAINSKRSEPPINIRWGGRLYFVDSEDRLRRIDDQGSFEIALKYLQARHKDCCFPFEFQEAEDKKIRMDALLEEKIGRYWGVPPEEARQGTDAPKEENRPQSASTKNPRLSEPRRTQYTSSTASRLPQRQVPKVETPATASPAPPATEGFQRSSGGGASEDSSSRGRGSLGVVIGEMLRPRLSTSTLGDNRSLRQSTTNESPPNTPSSRFTKIRQSISGKKPTPTTPTVPEQKKWQYKVIKFDRYKRGYDEDEIGVAATSQQDHLGEPDDIAADELEEEEEEQEEELEDGSNKEELMVMKSVSASSFDM